MAEPKTFDITIVVYPNGRTVADFNEGVEGNRFADFTEFGGSLDEVLDVVSERVLEATNSVGIPTGKERA